MTLKEAPPFSGLGGELSQRRCHIASHAVNLCTAPTRLKSHKKQGETGGTSPRWLTVKSLRISELAGTRNGPVRPCFGIGNSRANLFGVSAEDYSGIGSSNSNDLTKRTGAEPNETAPSW